MKNDTATPLTISNFSRAWQAYFLSYTLQIWCENTTFIDVQMMCNDDFDISIGFRFEKIHVSCTVHFYSLYLPKLGQLHRRRKEAIGKENNSAKLSQKLELVRNRTKKDQPLLKERRLKADFSRIKANLRPCEGQMAQSN